MSKICLYCFFCNAVVGARVTYFSLRSKSKLIGGAAKSMLLYNDNTIDLFNDIGRRNCVCAVVDYGREQKNLVQSQQIL